MARIGLRLSAREPADAERTTASLSSVLRSPARDRVSFNGHEVPKYVREFWTSKQRQASSINEISYRACFKPQLPRFFIQWLTQANDIVYDPFSGRGTTVIEAGLLARRIVSNDANPLSALLARPRFSPPNPDKLEERLSQLPFNNDLRPGIELSMFFHPKTLEEIVGIRNYLAERRYAGQEDHIDQWIRMVASNRLTGHSAGFFSVYTLPPNQAVSPESQIKINDRLHQQPEYRDTSKIILKKTRSLLRNLTASQSRNLRRAGNTGIFLTKDASHTDEIASEIVQLTVTSPPFLDIVQYSKDNWLRCWFNGLDVDKISKQITMSKTLEDWRMKMRDVFQELFRVTRSGGWVAFEVGEVRNGTINLDEHVVPLGLEAGFECAGILINQQTFTKTANIWGIKNNSSGTNTNRIALFYKA
ncbi:MAG TPA: DNA methyltransferase [Desulfomonilaceae bacterium]|nr:DNA methyltransferase [Desulfomonilaceae bacterium]